MDLKFIRLRESTTKIVSSKSSRLYVLRKNIGLMIILVKNGRCYLVKGSLRKCLWKNESPVQKLWVLGVQKLIRDTFS